MSYLLYQTDFSESLTNSESPQQNTHNVQKSSQVTSSSSVAPQLSSVAPQLSSVAPTSSVTPQPKLSQGLSGLGNFLNYKTGTILTFAICFGIGGAFKDLIQHLVDNVILPILIKLLIFTKIYNINGVSDFIKIKSENVNVASAVSSLITFIFVLLTVYVIFILISNTVSNTVVNQ